MALVPWKTTVLELPLSGKCTFTTLQIRYIHIPACYNLICTLREIFVAKHTFNDMLYITFDVDRLNMTSVAIKLREV